jgi:hypothetical protein
MIPGLVWPHRASNLVDAIIVRQTMLTETCGRRLDLLNIEIDSMGEFSNQFLGSTVSLSWLRHFKAVSLEMIEFRLTFRI